MKGVPFGDGAVEIRVSDAAAARRVAAVVERDEEVLECVVGWDRVLVVLREGAEPAEVCARWSAVDDTAAHEESFVANEHVVRAVYDGPDLPELADATGLSVEEIARRHAAPVYVVEVIGFLPGFAYLGTVDAALARPRRATPRTRVPPSSIGIAGSRTAIYPSASPGGWNLVGRAIDVVPFEPRRSPPSLFAVGDRIRFVVEDVR